MEGRDRNGAEPSASIVVLDHRRPDPKLSALTSTARVRAFLIDTAAADDEEPSTATAHLRSVLGQLLGHIEPCMTGRLAFDPGGNLPALFLIEARRLKVECGQHRAGAPRRGRRWSRRLRQGSRTHRDSCPDSSARHQTFGVHLILLDGLRRDIVKG